MSKNFEEKQKKLEKLEKNKKLFEEKQSLLKEKENVDEKIKNVDEWIDTYGEEKEERAQTQQNKTLPIILIIAGVLISLTGVGAIGDFLFSSG